MRATDCQGLVTATVTPDAAVDTLMADLGSAFAALGVAVRTLFHTPSHPNPHLMVGLMAQLRDGGMPAFILNCNAKDRLVVGTERGREITVHEAWNIPLIAFLVDHPACHLPHLLRAPENCLITVIDEGHLAFLEQAGLPPRSVLFCPHGGPEAIPDPRPMRERGLGLLFAGNVADPGPEAAWLDRASGGRPGSRAALAEALERVRLEGGEPYASLAEAYGRRDLPATPLTLARMVVDLDAYVMMARRFQVLSAIRGHRVTVAGEGAASAAAAHAHHDLRGVTSFARVRNLMADSRVVINSRVTFQRGGHERIFYGLSRGAVVATEAGSFLRPDLDAGLGMVPLPAAAADLDDFISDLLAGPDRLETLREQGLAVYPHRHSWRERAGRILAGFAAHVAAGNSRAAAAP